MKTEGCASSPYDHKRRGYEALRKLRVGKEKKESGRSPAVVGMEVETRLCSVVLTGHGISGKS